MPQVEWINPDGMTVTSGGSVVVEDAVTIGTTTVLVATFNPVRTSHGGQYMCQATLSSPDLSSPASAFVFESIIVQSM